MTPTGVEIGTAQAVLISWSDVQSATVHGRSLLATLHIVPKPSADLVPQPGPGRPPLMRRCDGHDGYLTYAGLFPGGAAGVLSTLRARGFPRTTPPTSLKKAADHS